MGGGNTLDCGDIGDLVTPTATDAAPRADAQLAPLGPEDAIDDMEAALDELCGKANAEHSVKAPASTKPPVKRAAAEAAAPASANTATFKVYGTRAHVTCALEETWSIVGSTIKIPNHMWGLQSGSTNCKVAGLLRATGRGPTAVRRHSI